jgi:hypothetical protein
MTQDGYFDTRIGFPRISAGHSEIGATLMMVGIVIIMVMLSSCIYNLPLYYKDSYRF